MPAALATILISLGGFAFRLGFAFAGHDSAS
jgi:hypothetical protein